MSICTVMLNLNLQTIISVKGIEQTIAQLKISLRICQPKTISMNKILTITLIWYHLPRDNHQVLLLLQMIIQKGKMNIKLKIRRGMLI